LLRDRWAVAHIDRHRLVALAAKLAALGADLFATVGAGGVGLVFALGGWLGYTVAVPKVSLGGRLSHRSALGVLAGVPVASGSLDGYEVAVHGVDRVKVAPEMSQRRNPEDCKKSIAIEKFRQSNGDVPAAKFRQPP
jgi:hypothetical protein